MKKPNIFFIIGCIMVITAIVFIIFSLNYPEMSFPWSNSITYIIYGLYVLLAIFMFFKSRER